MDTFAHAGLDHGTKAEAAAHSIGTVLLTFLLVSAAVLAVMIITVFLLKRFSVIELPANDEEKE